MVKLPIYLSIGSYMGDDDDRSRWKEMIISRSCRQRAKIEDPRWCKEFTETHGKSDELQVTRCFNARSVAQLFQAPRHSYMQVFIVLLCHQNESVSELFCDN